MPITHFSIACTWEECNDSGGGTVSRNGTEYEKKYATYGPANEADADVVARLNLASFLNVNGRVYFLTGFKCTPEGDGLVWLVTAQYKFDVAFTEMSFDTSGSQGKIYQALDEGDYYNCAGTGDPDDLSPEGQGVESLYGLINVNGENVDGVEITLPDKFDFTFLIRAKMSTLSSSYIDTLSRLTGKCNDRGLVITYRGQQFPFAAEELLFMGTPGKQNSDDDVELALKFSVSRGKRGGAKTVLLYTQPAVGNLVEVYVNSVGDLAIGDRIYIVGGGTYEVVDIDFTTPPAWSAVEIYDYLDEDLYKVSITPTPPSTQSWYRALPPISGGIALVSSLGVSPIAVETDTPHGLITGDYVAITDVHGNEAANASWYITVTGPKTFTLDTSVPDGLYTGGGNFATINLNHQPPNPRYWAPSAGQSPVLTLRNLGLTENEAAGEMIVSGALVSFDANDRNPISIRNSNPISKKGWRYLHTKNQSMMVGATLVNGKLHGGTRAIAPQFAVVNKLIETADLSIIGIFT